MSSPGQGDQLGAPAYAILAIASSAGGISALRAVLSSFTGGFPAPVLLVQHLDPRHETILPSVLSRKTSLKVKLAEDREQILPGVAYVAPPNRHLLVGRGGVLSLTETELVHFVRPSADLLFESVAASFADRAVAVVLTGSGTDGAMGVRAVKDRNGTVIVQDPDDAEFTGMPRAAMETNAADFVLTLAEIGPVIQRLFETEDHR
ncbi:chemotaxis protein CheB [Actinopolymorpha sp. B9G3]|uniref:chemotaxis protein CheB n=1 Tax=Actinopolymorpha sp. B9G3 TaxID=3158970 RepID=UPI0032D91893